MAEKIDYIEAVRESIIAEHKEFKEEMLKKSSAEVYAEFGKIYAYENLKKSLADWIFDKDVCENFGVYDEKRSLLFAKCLYSERGSILACLYDEYISDEGRMIGNSDLVDNLLNDYTNDYYPEIRKEFEKDAVAE